MSLDERGTEWEISLGQRHDRMGTGSRISNGETRDASQEPEPDPQISVGQRMLSAVSGSLLTSLLGRSNTPLSTQRAHH